MYQISVDQAPKKTKYAAACDQIDTHLALNKLIHLIITL